MRMGKVGDARLATLLVVGSFRTSVFYFFAIAAFAERDQHTSTILVTACFWSGRHVYQ